MGRRGKSKVEIESDSLETPHRKKRERGWYVCYILPDNPLLWWMLKVRAADEDGAWAATLKKLKREGKSEGAYMKYAKCVEE